MYKSLRETVVKMEDSCCSNIIIYRLKNLPFTFTKLKELAALWLSDNQVTPYNIHIFFSKVLGVLARAVNETCSLIRDCGRVLEVFAPSSALSFHTEV